MRKNYRRCISCRHIAHKDCFWQIVRTYPEHKIELDRGMGRSAYICPQESCLTKAKQKKRLQRTLKVAVSEKIYHILENRLKEQPTKIVHN